MSTNRLISTAVGLVFGLFALGFGLHWTVNRVYVPAGMSLQLRYKGPLLFGDRQEAEPGEFAKADEIGIQEQLRGPGRHFYCPIWWERTLVVDQIVKPGEVAVVTSKLGQALPVGEFLVDGDLDGEGRATQKGILRKVFGPGRYRPNPYAFEFNIVAKDNRKPEETQKHAGWIEIPAGYVGVVTFLSANESENKLSGIQDDVLPPGIYPINPREQQVDIFEIGYRETSSTVVKQQKGNQVLHDESGEPIAVAETGISFPSNDGFPIQLDFTAIWGVLPKDAPNVVRTFGSIEQVNEKVIKPQSESICRNTGSSVSAVELLVGESRQEFQTTTSESFQEVLLDKHITLLYGLVRHIYIPQQVRKPIQMGYVAEELTLTRAQERLTATTEAQLREAEATVDLEAEKVIVETTKLVAEALATGEKKARELAADTSRQVAAIDKEVASLESQKIVLLGEADAQAEKLEQEAKSQKFALAVESFGDATSYTKWQFAEGLPEMIGLQLMYAGEGTLWTDLKNVTPTLPVRSATSPANKTPRRTGKTTTPTNPSQP